MDEKTFDEEVEHLVLCGYRLKDAVHVALKNEQERQAALADATYRLDV